MPKQKLSKKRKVLNFITCSCCSNRPATDSDEELEPMTSTRCIMQEVAVIEEVDPPVIALKETNVKLQGIDNPSGDTIQNKQHTPMPPENVPRVIGNGEDIINIPEIIISVDVDSLYENEQRDFIESIDGVLPVAHGDITDIPVATADTGQYIVYEEPIKPKYIGRRNSVPNLFADDLKEACPKECKIEEVATQHEDSSDEMSEIETLVNHVIQVSRSIVSNEEQFLQGLAGQEEEPLIKEGSSISSRSEALSEASTVESNKTIPADEEDAFVEDMIGHLLNDILNSVSQDSFSDLKSSNSLTNNISPMRNYYQSTSGSNMIWGRPTNEAAAPGFPAGLHGGILVPSCARNIETDVDDAVVETAENVETVSSSVSLEWDTYWSDKEVNSEKELLLKEEESLLKEEE